MAGLESNIIFNLLSKEFGKVTVVEFIILLVDESLKR
jgi:hypothetical protein